MPADTLSSQSMLSRFSCGPLDGHRKSPLPSVAWKISAILSLAGPIYPHVNKEISQEWGRRVEKFGVWWSCVQNKGSEPCRELLGFGRELVHLSRVVLLVPAFLIAVGVFSLVLNILWLLWALLKRAHNEVVSDKVPQEIPTRMQVEREFRPRRTVRRHSAAF